MVKKQQGQGFGQVHYQAVGADYLERRRLKQGLTAPWMLWVLGVGAVIGGDFFGWNLGLLEAGFGGMLLATLFVALMYLLLVYSLAEMSAALPHAGGFYSFARSAFGAWGGFLMGVLITIQYVLTPATGVVAVGAFFGFFMPEVPVYLWWLLIYGFVIAINALGVRRTFSVGALLCALSVGLLLFFYLTALVGGNLSLGNLFNVPATAFGSGFLPQGYYGVFVALPYAIWFYIVIEQLPLSAEETVNPGRSLPFGLIYGTFTLIALSLLTLVLNTALPGGALLIGSSETPLATGFEVIFGGGRLSLMLMFMTLVGIFAGIHLISYANSRVIFALSRAGYYPRFLSLTTKDGAPVYALVAGAGLGLLGAALIQYFGSEAVGTALLNMAVASALMSYIGVQVAYMRLQVLRYDLPRPYSSPTGFLGALGGAFMALLALGAFVATPAYRSSILGVFVVLGIMALYFALYSSKRLVAEAPEERTALEAPTPEDLMSTLGVGQG